MRAAWIILPAPRLLVLVGCLLVGSCGSAGFHKELGTQQEVIAVETSRVAGTSRRPSSLSWKEARERMLKEDLSLRQSQARLVELGRQKKSQWKDWLPRPTLYVSLQNSFRELGNFSSDQLSSAFYAPLTIPNPWTETAKYYQYALQEVQATDYLELSRRRQVISLYRLFVEWDRLENPPSAGDARTIEDQVQLVLRARESEVVAEERRQMFFGQLSRMLNLPGTNVTPRTDTLPVIDYERALGSLVPGKNYGQLATRLSSYEIEAAILRRKGIRFVEWPAPNFNASVPAVYDSRREGDQFADAADQISLFGSWSKSVDLTGREAANIQSAEDNVGFVRESLRVKLDSEGRTWDRLRTRYRMLIEKRGLQRDRLAATLRSGASAGNPTEGLKSARQLMMDLQNLERAKQDLDMEIWLWDDKAWN